MTEKKTSRTSSRSSKTGAKKTSAKKTGAGKSTAKSTSTSTSSKRAASSKTTSTSSRRNSSTGKLAPQTVSAAELHSLIAETAYYIAEKRGFAGGNPQEDWLQAEQEIRSRFAA